MCVYKCAFVCVCVCVYNNNNEDANIEREWVTRQEKEGNKGYLVNDVNTAFTYEILKNLEDLMNL